MLDKKDVLTTIHRTLRDHTPRPQFPEFSQHFAEGSESSFITILCNCSDMEDMHPDVYREHLAAELFRAMDELEQDTNE